jgi:hypothetical protein
VCSDFVVLDDVIDLDGDNSIDVCHSIDVRYNNLRMAGQIFMKFGMQNMPLKCRSDSYFFNFLQLLIPA